MNLNLFLKIFLIATLFFAILKLLLVYSEDIFGPEKEHNSTHFTIEDFVKCLSERGLVMYGVDDCQYCQLQKKMFGSSFSYVHYVSCEFDKEICQKEAITQYPTWLYGDKKFLGVRTFQELASITSCTLPFAY